LVRQTAKVIFLEILAGLVVVSIVAVMLVAIRLASGPIELGFFKDDIERTLEQNRGGRKANLENISLEWLSDERRVVVTATDLVLFDDAGTPAARADKTEILLDISGLLLGRVRPIGLDLQDGWIGIHLAETGWSVAGDPIGSRTIDDTAQEALRAEELLALTNSVLVDVLSVLRRDALNLPLEQLTFEGMDIVFTQDGFGERARLGDSSGGFLRNEDGIALSLQGTGPAGEDAPAGFSASLSAPGTYDQINAALSLKDWSLEAAANVFPALVGTVQGLPSDLTVEAYANAQTGLERVTFSANAGQGEVSYSGTTQRVGKVALSGEYFPDTDKLGLLLSDFDIGPGAGDLSVEVEDLLKAENGRRFTLSGPRLALDLQPVFERVWPAERLKASGILYLDRREVALETASLEVSEAVLRLSGRIKALEDVKEREPPLELDLVAEVTGTLLPEEVMWFWPVKQAPGARSYVTRVVEAGRITGATAKLDIKRDSISQGHLADEALEVEFSIADARVRPLPDIPVIEGLNGVGQMTGNSLRITYSDGMLEDWNIKGGEVYYPQLSPAGADMHISIEGNGPAQSLVRFVSESRLQLQARSGLDPATISGDAEMSLTMTRPAKPKVPLSEYRYQGEGHVRDGGMASVFNGLSLTGSRADVSLSEKGIRIAGDGRLARSPIDYDWSLAFGEPGVLADLKATTLVTPDVLNAFGIVGRAYFTGEAPVELEARLAGAQLRAVDAAFDLLGARLDVAELDWVKPKGEPASASLLYNAIDGPPVTTARLDTENADLDGTFTLEKNGKLVSANIERAFLKDRIDVSGTAVRTETGGLGFKLAGKYLDLSRVISQVSAFTSEQANEDRKSYGEVSVEAEIEKVTMRTGFATRDTRLSLFANDDGIQTIEAAGLLPNGADISAAFDASGLGDPSFLVTSGDASFLANVFLETDALEGGTLQMSGTLATGDLPTQVRLVIENGRLKDAPFVTQILSLASIRGLSDTLAGDGVLFSIAELPLTIVGGRYNVVGARASGPALGLTANGWLTPATGEIDIDGVLVPSFGLNSALGGLPVIGNLFISRRGEGVISLRYGVEGTLEKAQVSVNPLSAITPGVLRRIFEDPAEAELPPIEAPSGDEAPAGDDPIQDE